ncbi:MAG TPA: hypothetical protein VHF89_18800 [Solirubrobacteraceae bacterium]|nr:hypothetical protein [Solirubrobacteraceae bacterium]
MSSSSDGRAAWPDHVDEILGGDQTIALGYLTPARGVVVTPVTNFSVRDRADGTITAVNSSAGVWRKLERIRREPRVALAYHTRAHGFTDRPEYVLVHGRATLLPPDPNLPRTLGATWERSGGLEDRSRLEEWWLRAFLHRVAIEVAVERVVVWPDLTCRGEPEVHGAPLPGDPPPQRAPRDGTGPRIRLGRAVRRARGLPNVLLGWAGADGFPVIVPVGLGGTTERGVALDPPFPLPPGGRRAGLTAHAFTRYGYGQVLRKHTGWLEDGVYAPHTERGYHLPESRLLFTLASGFVTRRGLRAAPERYARV